MKQILIRLWIPMLISALCILPTYLLIWVHVPLVRILLHIPAIVGTAIAYRHAFVATKAIISVYPKCWPHPPRTSTQYLADYFILGSIPITFLGIICWGAIISMCHVLGYIPYMGIAAMLYVISIVCMHRYISEKNHYYRPPATRKSIVMAFQSYSKKKK